MTFICQKVGRKRKIESEGKPLSKKRKGKQDDLMAEPLDQTMIHPESYRATYKYPLFIFFFSYIYFSLYVLFILSMKRPLIYKVD